MAVTNTNMTTKVSTDQFDLMTAKIDAKATQVYQSKAVLVGSPAILRKPLNPGDKSFTLHWEIQADNTMNYKARGADRTLATTTKGSKTISHEDPLYCTEGLAWQDKDILPTWDVVGPAVDRQVTKYIEQLEYRLTQLLTQAAQAASSFGGSGVHSGGIYTQKTAASVAARYPFTAAGADQLLDDMAEIEYLRMNRKEKQGTNRLWLFSPYLRQVLTRSNRWMSRDWNAQANLPMSYFGNSIEGAAYAVSRYMPSTAITSDAISKYNVDAAVGGAGQGIPAVLLICYGEDISPVCIAEHGSFKAETWWNQDEDVWKTGGKAIYGADQAHVWNAGGVFIHS